MGKTKPLLNLLGACHFAEKATPLTSHELFNMGHKRKKFGMGHGYRNVCPAYVRPKVQFPVQKKIITKKYKVCGIQLWGLMLGVALLCWESNPETQVSVTPCMWVFCA